MQCTNIIFDLEVCPNQLGGHLLYKNCSWLKVSFFKCLFNRRSIYWTAMTIVESLDRLFEQGLNIPEVLLLICLEVVLASFNGRSGSITLQKSILFKF